MREFDPKEVLQIHGANLTDAVFSLDRSIAGEQLHWNISRIERDADRGMFGPPQKRYFKNAEAMTAAQRENIDWKKVRAITADWALLNRPGLAVDLDAGTFIHRHIVDGNHRIAARELVDVDHYYVFVVPVDLEPDYRVTFSDGNGRPMFVNMDGSFSRGGAS